MTEPKRARAWSIRRRLLTALAVFAVVVLLLSGEPVRRLETEALAQILRNQYSRSLDSLAPVLQDHVITKDAELDLPVLQRIVSDFLRTHEEVVSMRIEDSDGNPLVEESTSASRAGGSTFEVGRALKAGDYLVGRVDLVVDLHDLEAQVGRHVLRLQVLFTALLFIAAFILVSWFYRIAVHPLRLIDEKLRKLLAGEQIEAVPFRGAEEFLRLNDSVDALACAVQLQERQKELELQLQQSQKLEAIGRLAGGVAHDFNNMLTVIVGYAEVLTQDVNLDEQGRNDARQIVSAGDRAAALTRQLLAFSRKQVLQPAIVNPAEILHGMQEMLERLLGEQVELSVHVEEPVGLVEADINQLEQVLLNLTVNSRDAMPRGGRLEFSLYRQIIPADADLQESSPIPPGAYVVMAVRDNGSGMDQQTRERIFEPFFSTKKAGEGTGLGLAMVYGIVSQSGGYIDLESQLGEGTTFRVYLPEVEGQVDPVARDPKISDTVVGGTVLVVEDEILVRRLTCEILESEGFEVLMAGDSEGAFEIADGHAGSIDLLVTDVVLPGMSGVDISIALRERRPEINILLVSGYDNGLLGPEELKMAYLQKPFDRSTLINKVREVMLSGR